MALVSASRTTRWKTRGNVFDLVPPTIPQPTIPAPDVTRDATVHALVGAQYGDLEFDAGKSVRWTQWFADTVYITDINTGDQRYWVINWTASFPKAFHGVTDINFFVVPTEFRKEQFRARLAEHNLPITDDDWVLFVDAHEGMSCDATSLPNDIGSHPFRAYLFREVTRAIAAGQDFACIPFFIFLRHATATIEYPHDGGIDPNDPNGPGTIQQPVAVPYYVPYQGLRRLWKVSALKSPTFDWTLLDQPAATTNAPGTGIPQVDGYLTPTVGTVSTPDPGTLPADCVFVYTVQGPTGGVDHAVAAQWQTTAANLGWAIFARPAGNKNFNFSRTGADTFTRTLLGPAPTGTPEKFATVLTNTDGIVEVFRWTGTAWVSVARTTSTGTALGIFDSTLALRIGATTSGNNPFAGRIYSVECRTGNNPDGGTLVWKFDANDYVSGTTMVSNGRTWTLTNASAITPKVPAVPAVPAVKIQIVSYAYAHWNIQDIVPPNTTVPALDINNDDGWRMRQLISRVRPHALLPYDTPRWDPSNDPPGTAGPWGFAQPDSPDPIAGTPAPPAVLPATAGILTPLYDLTFRINLRDGLFYASDSLGNIPLQYDNDTDTWVPVVLPEDWHETDTYVTPGP